MKKWSPEIKTLFQCMVSTVLCALATRWVYDYMMGLDQDVFLLSRGVLGLGFKVVAAGAIGGLINILICCCIVVYNFTHYVE